MKIENKVIWIYWKNNVSTYAKLNTENIAPSPKLIGGSISAVDAMLSNGEEQNALMPTILGVSANSQNWNTVLTNYWNNVSAEIPAEGKKLEIGFMYDVESSSRKAYIDAVNKGITKESDRIKTDTDLALYIDTKLAAVYKEFEKNFAEANKTSDERAKGAALNTLYRNKYLKVVELESERYKLGTPIDTEQYMLYRYCLVYRDVANEFKLSDKSPNIRFYLHSEKDIKAHKEQQKKIQKDRISSFLKAVKSLSMMENVLFALGLGSELASMDDSDKYLKLEEYSKDDATTSKFINTVENPDLLEIANIEKYVAIHVLARIAGSSIITDALDTSVVIGNNMNEAIAYFKLDKNKPVVSEYINRFKALPK